MENKMGGIDIAAAARACLAETDRLVAKHGARLAGTRSCAATAEDIARTMRTFADSVRGETFRVHPGSFYAYMKLLPPAYLVGLITLLAAGRMGQPAVAVLGALALIGLLAGIVLMTCQFGFYRHLGDRLFARRTGTNVEAVIEPVDTAEREIILSGHHDSAPVARIFSGPFSRFYAVAIIAPYLFYLGEVALLAARVFGAPQPAGAWMVVFLLAGLPFVVGYFCMVDLRRGTPGAGDNLISSIMVVVLGKEMAARRKAMLRTTRIRIVSFDAEEAGLRGASAYFRAHAAEMKRLPCVHLNFDSLYRLGDLQALTSDINGTVKLSPVLVDQLVACARECGLAMRTFGMIFGAGGTDAAESARAGIPSSSIIAIPTEIVREGLVYHTPRDTVEHVEPAVVEACMRIVLRFLERLEAGRVPGS
jgi:acetylornithine deacetylase/succinyl-diaminopimelate desuccinylase-like protein